MLSWLLSKKRFIYTDFIGQFHILLQHPDLVI